MKLLALQQSNRRSNSFRGSAPLDSASSEGSIRSPAAIFWLVLHGLCCLISLILGFRFSRLVFFFIFSTTTTLTTTTTTTNLLFPAPFRSVVYGELNRSSTTEGSVATVNSGSRVVVGRHGIRIRPWPHPDPIEVMKAHQIIDTVQREQRRQFGVKSPRALIVVTPTYVRTFQALHMTGLMHSLMLVPYDVIWIVVEAGGATNETASILAKSGLRTIHLDFDQRMPNSWEGRHRLEARMRLHALRSVNYLNLICLVQF